jgi:hypothetical protein
MLNIAMSGGATRKQKRLEATIMDMNQAMALPPSCATMPVFPCPAMAVIMSAIKSGITVMRMAFTHSVPMGSIIDGNFDAELASRSEKPIPPSRPSASPRSMRAEELMAVSLGSFGLCRNHAKYCVLSTCNQQHSIRLDAKQFPAKRYDCSGSGTLIPSIAKISYSLE